MIQQRAKVIGGKTCPTVTLSTAKLTSNDLESNPGLRGERLVSSGINRDTAFKGQN